MVAHRTLMMSGLCVAGLLAACARVPEASTARVVAPAQAAQPGTTEPPAMVTAHPLTPTTNASQPSASVGPRLVTVHPEELAAQEVAEGAQSLRVQVVRREGKYPLVRREEVLERGAAGVPKLPKVPAPAAQAK